VTVRGERCVRRAEVGRKHKSDKWRKEGGGRWETTRVFVRDLRVFKSLGIELKVNTKAVVVGVSSRV